MYRLKGCSVAFLQVLSQRLGEGLCRHELVDGACVRLVSGLHIYQSKLMLI
jgi:hypothetical protein